MIADRLQFDEEAHRYYLDGIELPSVSSMLARLKPPFDAPAAAARVARREGREPGEVLAEWDAKRDRACDLGHLVHTCIEAHLIGGDAATDGLVDPIIDPEFGILLRWYAWWNRVGKKLEPVKVEHRMASVDLWVAGTMDALMYSGKTGEHHVFDWKTNGTLRTHSQYRENLLPPFDDLPNCEMSIYSIQLSIYRLLIEPEYATGDSWIIHLTPEGVTPYRCGDYRERARRWLEGIP